MTTVLMHKTRNSRTHCLQNNLHNDPSSFDHYLSALNQLFTYNSIPSNIDAGNITSCDTLHEIHNLNVPNLDNYWGHQWVNTHKLAHV